MIADEFLGAVLQLLAFTLIPLSVYVIQTKKLSGFFQYIGLKPSNWQANAWALLASLLFAGPTFFMALGHSEMAEVLRSPESVTGKFRAMEPSFTTWSILLAFALIKTSLAEEILFRGFMAKRLIAWLGFSWGNLVQALLFGALHSLLFLSITQNVGFLLLILLIPTLGAYVSGFLNERKANGSIIPGWISHGVANILSYSLVGLYG